MQGDGNISFVLSGFLPTWSYIAHDACVVPNLRRFCWEGIPFIVGGERCFNAASLIFAFVLSSFVRRFLAHWQHEECRS